MVSVLNFPQNIFKLLKANVQDFILNGSWNIPDALILKCPLLAEELKRIAIPKFPSIHHLVWNDTDSGLLNFKDAHCFVSSARQQFQWPKLIWKGCILPSRSFLAWRILHDRLSTDENLIMRGCVIVSRCNLCGIQAESTSHIFLRYDFAQKN